MAKKKDRSELEYLRGLNRQLKSELRKCKQNLKYHTKRSNDYDDEEIEEIIDQGPFCPSCGKGSLEEKDLKYIQLLVCNICEYRKKITS